MIQGRVSWEAARWWACPLCGTGNIDRLRPPDSLEETPGLEGLREAVREGEVACRSCLEVFELGGQVGARLEQEDSDG